MDPASLYRSPNALASHYSRFRVSQRLLLTGHSHQAWPDRGFEAQSEAWLDAARYVDDKWDRAFARAQEVRQGFTRLLGDGGEGIALAPNTHELVVRLLSALPLRTRPRLVTTDGEFHTIRRQLDRLAEEGLEVVRIAERPVETVSERLARAVDHRTSLVLASAVFFDTARIARGLGEVAAQCRRHGATLLVDAYHALNVVPFSLGHEGLDDAFVVGGGYKYCQLGEGNCFLRLPPGTALRPVVTGWYSEFTALAERQETGRVVYGQGGDRFAGATYDPTSHYRAAAVFAFFREQGLEAALLGCWGPRRLARWTRSLASSSPPTCRQVSCCRDRGPGVRQRASAPLQTAQRHMPPVHNPQPSRGPRYSDCAGPGGTGSGPVNT